MTNTNDALARAIDYLGAVEVAPGRYAVPDTNEGAPPNAWVVIGFEHPEVRRLLDQVETFPVYAETAALCALTHGIEMPAWWSPEHRIGWRDKSGRSPTHVSHPGFDEPNRDRLAAGWDRITASLETGEEVPA